MNLVCFFFFFSALSKELPTNVVDPFSPKTGTQLPSQIQSPFATSHPETSKQSIEISALPPMNASIRNISPPRAAINQTSDSNFKFSISTIPPAPSPVIEKPLPIDIKPPPTLDPKIESAKALEESQRKLQIQDAARRELLEENRRLKLQQLEHLGAGVQKKVAQRLMKTVFSVWIEGNRAGLAKRRLLIQRLMFMVWRKNYSKIVARSAILNSSLSSIVENSFMLSPSLPFSRNIRKLNVPSSPRVRSRKLVIPLNLAMSGLVGSRSLRWFQQTVCNTMAPTLFYRQTNLLREYLAFPFKFNFSDRSGPLWNRKLLMNIALLSPVTSTSPFWDISSGFVENFVRGLFSVASNSSEFFSSWEMNSECFVKGTSIISRKCHVVITEHLDDTIPLSGLIVLPTGASSETVHRLLLQAAILVEYNVPLVILLIIERTSGSPTSTWAEIHSASENIILSNFLQSLADECQRPISISKAYVVDIYLHSEIINSISNQFNISSGYYRNTMLEIMNCIATCLLDGIQSLCSHVALLPPIRRVDISRWCEERLTDALWSDDPHQCSDEMLVQLFSEMSVALHKCEELISKDSKALESMTFPFQIFQNPEKRVVEDVLYLNMNEHTSDRDACDLPIDWQSASSHSIAMEIIEKFRLPDWTFDGDLIFQWKQFCERLREKGWTLPRDSSHLLTALFEAKTAAADFSQGGKRRRSGEHHNSFIRLEKFYTLFRRWLTLLVQLRAESLSSLETVVYLCVADGSPSADDRQLWNPLKASSIQDTLSNWKSQQLLRLSEEIESEPSIQSEEDHLEPQTLSPTTLGSDSVTSPAPLEIDAGQIYCLSNSVQSEAEKYQLLEKRLLQQVGHEFTENPKQRRRMSHSGHHQGDLIEDYLTKCARERTLFEEYLDIAL